MTRPALPRTNYFPLALLALAFPLLPAGGSATEDCPGAYKPDYEKAWGLTQAWWAARCAQGKTPRDILEEAQEALKGSKKPAAGPKEKEGGRNSPAGPSAEGLGSALQGDVPARLNKLYDFSGANAEVPVIAGPQGKPGPPLSPAGPGKPGAPPVGAPGARDEGPPLDPNEVSKYVGYEPPRTWLSRVEIPVIGGLLRFIDDFIVRPLISLFSGRERRFASDMTDRLQQSPEGRNVLRDMIAEGKATGRKIAIRAKDYPGSPITVRKGVEQISGMRGEALYEERVFNFNDKFMDMKDRDSALDAAASNMGHELRHFILHARVKRELPEYLEVFEFSLADEESARLKGYLVAWQLSKGKPSFTIWESQAAIRDPQGFLSQMKLWAPAYASGLDEDEMLDPVAAFNSRLESLRKTLNDHSDELAEAPFLLKRIDHMSAAHATAGSLSELRQSVVDSQLMLPSQIEGIKASIDFVEKRKAYLGTEKGLALIARMRQAVQDPRYRAILKEVTDDFNRVADYVRTQSFGALPPSPGQLAPQEFGKLWEKFHEAVPGDPHSWKERDAPQ